MKKKKIHITRVCEICGNEIYKYGQVVCPYCEHTNKKTTRKEAVKTSL